MNITHQIEAHKSLTLKVLSILVSIVLFVGAGIIITNSQNVKSAQAKQSQEAVANHTQTLLEIQQAVTQLKSSNAADHKQTVKYINCVLVGITDSPTQSQALAVYQECLAASGVTQ